MLLNTEKLINCMENVMLTLLLHKIFTWVSGKVFEFIFFISFYFISLDFNKSREQKQKIRKYCIPGYFEYSSHLISIRVLSLKFPRRTQLQTV